MAERKGIESPVSQSEKSVKSPNATKQAQEGSQNNMSPRHEKETHGTSDDIDESTPIDEVKGPGVFERVKEEIEAVVGSVVHPKK